VQADKFIRDLEAKDILISDMGGGKLRMVTHLDYSSKMHQKLLEVLETVS
jgi:threonine aldolase